MDDDVIVDDTLAVGVSMGSFDAHGNWHSSDIWEAGWIWCADGAVRGSHDTSGEGEAEIYLVVRFITKGPPKVYLGDPVYTGAQTIRCP